MVDMKLEVVVIPVSDVATITELPQETEQHHGPYEATAPKHHWSGWYAAYIVARQRGRTPEAAAQDAATINADLLAFIKS